MKKHFRDFRITFALLSLIFFSLTPYQTFSQIKFQRTYGIGTYNEGRSVKQTLDGGYIVAGTESDAGNGATDIYLLKVDSAGNFQWHKTFGGIGIDHGYAVEQLNDSGYAVAGFTNSFGAGGYDSYLVRTDKNGNFLWSKTYGTPDWDFTYAMKKTSDGGFVLAGNSYGTFTGNSNPWVMHLDSIGGIIWDKQLSFPSNCYLNATIQTPEDDYVAVGYCEGGINNSEDILALKLSSIGDSIWSYTYGDSGNDVGTSVDTTLPGGYIIGATITNTSTTFGDYYLIKIDDAGLETWHNEFVSTAGDYLYSIHQLSNQGFVTSGLTIGAGGGGGDVSLIFTDSSGNFSGSASYGTAQREDAYDLSICSDKGFIIVGKTNGVGPELESVYLIKTDSTGLTNSTIAISTNELSPQNHQLLCYPNPVSKYLHVPLDNLDYSLIDGAQLQINNLTGQIIFSTAVDKKLYFKKEIIIDVENILSGSYLLTITSDKINLISKFLLLPE